MGTCISGKFRPLLISLIFRRHRSDRLENNRTVHTLNESGQFVPKKWKDLKVGEVIRVASSETLPADLVSSISLNSYRVILFAKVTIL
jgi:hypothetical protein